MLYELILINEIEQRAKLIFLSVAEWKEVPFLRFLFTSRYMYIEIQEFIFGLWGRLVVTI